MLNMKHRSCSHLGHELLFNLKFLRHQFSNSHLLLWSIHEAHACQMESISISLDILWLYACVTIPECLKPSKIAFQCLCLSVGLCSLAMNVRWWLMLSRFPKVSCSTASSAGMILVRDRACSFHLATFPSACDTTSWQKSIFKRFIGFILMDKSSRVVFKSQNKMFLLL